MLNDGFISSYIFNTLIESALENIEFAEDYIRCMLDYFSFYLRQVLRHKDLSDIVKSRGDTILSYMEIIRTKYPQIITLPKYQFIYDSLIPRVREKLNRYD